MITSQSENRSFPSFVNILFLFLFFLLLLLSLLLLQVILVKVKKVLALLSFFGAAIYMTKSRFTVVHYSEKWCDFLLFKWMDENW